MARWIVTGAPGAGKTTVLEHLATLGYRVVPESARREIAERLARGLPPRPDPVSFVRAVLARDRAASTAANEGTVLFDRGLPDTLGSALVVGLHDEDEVRAELRRRPFEPRVLLFPPWPQIYRTDSERDQTYTEAVVVDGLIRRYYARFGFELLEIPRGTVEARAAHVAEIVGPPEPQDA